MHGGHGSSVVLLSPFPLLLWLALCQVQGQREMSVFQPVVSIQCLAVSSRDMSHEAHQPENFAKFPPQL